MVGVAELSNKNGRIGIGTDENGTQKHLFSCLPVELERITDAANSDLSAASSG